MTDKQKPIIGISGWKVESASVQAMCEQVRKAGGIPIILANHANRDPLKDIGIIDGLIVMGNNWDIDPKKYIDRYPVGDPRHQVHPKTVNQTDNPESKARAAYEEKMLALASERNMPVLAVCGGMQTINVLEGGGLLQHIPDQLGNEHHEQNTDCVGPSTPVIPVKIEKNSALGMLTGPVSSLYVYPGNYPPTAGEVPDSVNSFHHQAIDPDKLGAGLRIVASSDTYVNVNGEERRLPEAIEPDPNGRLKYWPMIGVQWHPEFGAGNVSANLIQVSVDRAEKYAEITGRDRSNDMHVVEIENMKSKTPLPVLIKPDVSAPLPTHSQPKHEAKVRVH